LEVTNTPDIIALKNKKLKGSTWWLLDRPADGYNRPSRQEKSTVQSREIRAKKTPDRSGPEQSKVK
jgi:hypothetical protein